MSFDEEGRHPLMQIGKLNAEIKQLKDKFRRQNRQIKILREEKELFQSRLRVYISDKDIINKINGYK